MCICALIRSLQRPVIQSSVLRNGFLFPKPDDRWLQSFLLINWLWATLGITEQPCPLRAIFVYLDYTYLLLLLSHVLLTSVRAAGYIDDNIFLMIRSICSVLSYNYELGLFTLLLYGIRFSDRENQELRKTACNLLFYHHLCKYYLKKHSHKTKIDIGL